ncbi:MAG: hypothetical protein ACKVWV_03630 [Planctomycetota bacterium]
MFARTCTRWIGALLIALTIGLSTMPVAEAAPVQSPCQGCFASSGPLPTFFSTGTSCGRFVGLRLGVTNFDGNCVPSPIGQCVENDPCKFVISLYYISDCQAVLSQGSTCGAFPVPAFLPAVPVWTLVANYTRAISCGKFCDFKFAIGCAFCTQTGASVGGRLKCSDCP